MTGEILSDLLGRPIVPGCFIAVSRDELGRPTLCLYQVTATDYWTGDIKAFRVSYTPGYARKISRQPATLRGRAVNSVVIEMPEGSAGSD